MADGPGGRQGAVATRPERRLGGQDRRGAARCRPVFPLRDWHESGKSRPSDRKYSLHYLPTLVAPFHAVPLHHSPGLPKHDLEKRKSVKHIICSFLAFALASSTFV